MSEKENLFETPVESILRLLKILFQSDKAARGLGNAVADFVEHLLTTEYVNKEGVNIKMIPEVDKLIDGLNGVTEYLLNYSALMLTQDTEKTEKWLMENFDITRKDSNELGTKH